MTQYYDDPYDAASDPQAPQFDYFGQIFLDLFFCVLEKGIGKVPFNPAQHSIQRRCTAVKIEVVPLSEQDFDFQILREMIAESKEYRDIVWPSLRDLGVTNIREIEGKYAQVSTVPTGRRYTNSEGDERQATTFQFVKLFETEADCRLAYNGGSEPVPQQVPAQAPLPTVENTPSSNGEKATAAKFLKVVVDNAARGQTDPQTVINSIQANITPNALLNKYWPDASCPEVMGMVMEAMAG